MKESTKKRIWVVIGLAAALAIAITIGWFGAVRIIQKDNPDIVYKNEFSLEAIGVMVGDDISYNPITKDGGVVLEGEVLYDDYVRKVF